MATFIPDTVEGSELTYTRVPGQASKVRGGLVTDITGDPAFAVDQCITATGMPALGAGVGIQGVTAIFNRLICKPISSDTCRVQLVYEAVDFGGGSAAYVISARSYMASYTTKYLPGNPPILIEVPAFPLAPAPGGGGPGTPSFYAKPQEIPGDVCDITILRVLREVSVRGVKVGQPYEGQYEEDCGLVNDSVWRGKPAGYWMVNDGGTDISRYAGYYSFHIAALTQNNEPWSTFAWLKNKVTNRYPPGMQADYAALMKLPYAYGVIGKKPGIMRIGPYATGNLRQIFGF